MDKPLQSIVSIENPAATPPVHHNLPRAFLFLIGAHIMFTLLDATGKTLASQMGVPLVTLVRHGMHALVMLLILTPLMGWAVVRNLTRTQRPGLQLARGLLLAGFTFSFFTGLRYVPQAEGTSILFLTPFFVMLLAGPLLGEKVTWVRWAGAALGFTGMLIIVRPGNNLAPLGVFFILLTVVCNVGFQLLTRKLSAIDNSIATIFIAALIGTLASVLALPLQEIWGGWPRTFSDTQLLLLGSMGVTGSVSQWCLIRAYYWSSASFIATLVFLQIVWATLSGWVFFGQLPDSLTVLGMAIICVTGVSVMLIEQRRSTPRA